MRLAGKVALITGGTSGIGRATAALFAREGARVALTGRDEVRGRVVLHEVKSAGSEGIFVRSDVRLADDCRRAVDETIKAFKRLDILFNNAGVFFPHTVPDSTEEEWDQTVDVNLKGTYLMSKFALPHMIAQRSGVIVNNSSGWGLVGGTRRPPTALPRGASFSSPRRWPSTTDGRGSGSTASVPATSRPRCCPKTRGCAASPGTSTSRPPPAGRSAGSASPRRSRARCCFWLPTTRRS